MSDDRGVTVHGIVEGGVERVLYFGVVLGSEEQVRPAKVSLGATIALVAM